MNSRPHCATADLPSPARRPWHCLLGRVLLITVVYMLVVFLVLIAVSGATPLTTATPLHGVAEPVAIDTVAMTRPLRDVQAAASTGALRCAGRTLARERSDQANATGFEIDVIVDHGSHTGGGHLREDNDRTDQPGGGPQDPMVITCGSRGQIVVLACDSNPRNQSHRLDRSNDPASYGDRFDRDDRTYNDVNQRDWDLDNPDQLRELDPGTLQEPGNDYGEGSHTGSRFAGVDITVDGLLSAHPHSDPATSDRRGERDIGDPWDLNPSDSDVQGPAAAGSPGERNYHDIDQRVGHSGVCRWDGHP